MSLDPLVKSDVNLKEHDFFFFKWNHLIKSLRVHHTCEMSMSLRNFLSWLFVCTGCGIVCISFFGAGQKKIGEDH